ncbi:uncharacterized protein LOC144584911 isoform X2 [Pogona vitticeps]
MCAQLCASHGWDLWQIQGIGFHSWPRMSMEETRVHGPEQTHKRAKIQTHPRKPLLHISGSRQGSLSRKASISKAALDKCGFPHFLTFF